MESATAHNAEAGKSYSSPMRVAATTAPRLILGLVLVPPLFAACAAMACAQTNFGQVNLGAGAASTVTITIPNAATLGSVVVATQGATALDFTNAGTGSCVPGTSYAAEESCTVEVAFRPVYAGTRLGAVQLEDGAGNVIASASLTGIGVGPQIAFDPGAATAIAPLVSGAMNESGLQQPYGVTVDGKGNVYIADGGHKRVVEMPAGNGAPIVIAPIVNGKGLSNPAGLAVDGAGDLFIADLAGDNVIEVPANGSAPVAIDPVVNGTGLKYPCGMAFDGAGDLFIADVDNSRVLEVPAGGGAVVVINPSVNGKTLNYPVAVALDSAGDLYISDLFANQVVKVPAGGGAAQAVAPTVDGEPLSFPYGIAVDGAGDLLIADANNRVVEVPAGGGAATEMTPTANGKGLNDPIGLALDGAGDLFIADTDNNRVVEVERSAAPELNFAAANVGSPSSDSPQTVEVENVGNAVLTFPVPASGSNPAVSANFTLASGGSGDCTQVSAGAAQAGTLAAGAACTLPISFQPGAAGTVYGGLALTDDSLNAAGPAYTTQTIALSGDAPVASLSAAILSFGPQQVGSASALQPLTLTNAGSAAMTIDSVNATGVSASAFTLTNGCGATLAAGASCTIRGLFQPTASGPMTAAVVIADNAPGSPQTVALNGAGAFLPTVTVTPAPSTITTAQALAVTIAVSGPSGEATATGSARLASGSYLSLPVVLAGGSATVNVPAGALAVGADTLTATYTPDIGSQTLYLGATGTGLVTVTAASTVAAPTAATGTASAVTATSATLAGTVNPNNAATQAWFLYGTSSTLSGASQTTSQALSAGNAPAAVSASVSGLSANTTYYYELVAQNSVGTTNGVIGSFTTTPAPYFSISNGVAISVAPGATNGNASTLTIEPWYGFSGTVTLSCAITPTAASDPATCNAPATVTVSDAAQTVTVTVTTTAAATAMNGPLRRGWDEAGGAALALLLLFGVRVRRRRWSAMLALLVVFVFALGMGCGGGGGGTTGPPPNPGTTAGPYTVTVTGTSQSAPTQTGTVALTVQ
jgi:sugar lactone lactonase YvrE